MPSAFLSHPLPIPPPNTTGTFNATNIQSDWVGTMESIYANDKTLGDRWFFTEPGEDIRDYEKSIIYQVLFNEGPNAIGAIYGADELAEFEPWDEVFTELLIRLGDTTDQPGWMEQNAIAIVPDDLDDNPIVYNGIDTYEAELGGGLGDCDITNIKYYNKQIEMSEILGFQDEIDVYVPFAKWDGVSGTNNGNPPNENGEYIIKQSTWNTLLTSINIPSLNMTDFPKLDNGFVNAYIEMEVVLSSADWYPRNIEITSTTGVEDSAENRQGFRKSIEASGINPGTPNEGTWKDGVNLVRVFIGDESDGGNLLYMSTEDPNQGGGNQVTIYENLYDFNRVQIGRSSTDSDGNTYDESQTIKFNYFKITVPGATIEEGDSYEASDPSYHPGNPDSPRYWKNIIKQDDDVVYSREGLEEGEYINPSSEQEWEVDENGNVPYYPVLPKYARDGSFIGEIGQEDISIYPNGKTPFPLNGPITDENENHPNLLINIINENVESGVLADSSGNQNLGFVFSDYKPRFDSETLKPKKVKRFSRIRTSKQYGAF